MELDRRGQIKPCWELKVFRAFLCFHKTLHRNLRDSKHQDKNVSWLSSWALLAIANETRPGERLCGFSLLVKYWHVSWYSLDPCQQSLLWKFNSDPRDCIWEQLLPIGDCFLRERGWSWGLNHAGKICLWWQKREQFLACFCHEQL